MDMFTSYGASLEARQSIASDLPASIELTPFDLLERELADESALSDFSAMRSFVWRRSHPSHFTESLSGVMTAFTPIPLGSGAALSVFSEHFASVFTDRIRSRLAELMEVFPEGDIESPPTADPQAVDSGWLDEIQSIKSRESGDLAAWYASMDEE